MLVSDHGSIVGGAEKVAFKSAVDLIKRGYKVTALIGADDADPELVAKGIEMICANLPVYSERFFGANRLERLSILFNDPVAESWFREQFQKFEPSKTVVHFHTFHSHATSAALKAAIDLGFKVICTCHDFNLVCPMSTFYNNVSQKPCEQTALSVGCWKTQCLAEGHRLHKILRNARIFGQNHVFGLMSKVKKFLMVSNHASKIISPYLPSASNVEVLRNPVDIPLTERVKAEANPDLLWIGRMTPEKNPEMLARVASAKGLRVVFAGDGPLRADLVSKYPEHSFTGWLTPEEIAAKYRDARALVLTSSWFETASLVVLDALSCGVPVVVPNITAATDWIVENESGFVFEYNSDESLANALGKLASDEQVKLSSEVAFENYWMDPPTLNRHVDGLIRIYDGVLSS